MAGGSSRHNHRKWASSVAHVALTPNSVRVLSWWHSWHSTWTFESTSSPPRDSGRTWSTSTPSAGEVTQAPVAPGRAPFLHSPAKPRSSVPAVRPSPAPCSSGADARATLVRPVVRLAASSVCGGLGAVDTAHVRPPGGGRRCVPAPGLEPGNSAECVRISPRGPVPRTSSRWVSGLACPRRLGASPDTVGTARAYSPFRRPRSRGGYSWAVRSPHVASRPLRPPPSNAGARGARATLVPRVGHSVRQGSPSGWVRGNPALSVRSVGTDEFLGASPLLRCTWCGLVALRFRE